MSQEEEEEEFLSDWEKEIDESTGMVFFLGGVDSMEEAERLLEGDENDDSKKKNTKSGVPGVARGKGLKLSRLVRRRESKRERSHPLSKRNAKMKEHSTEDQDDEEQFGNIQTFESLLEAPSESHVDSILVDFSILETVVEGDNLFVSGLKQPLEGGVSLRVGDWIRLIEGQRVTIHNVENILRKHRAKPLLKLTYQRETSKGGGASSLSFLSALFLSQRGVTEMSPEGSDILYAFPPSVSPRMLALRGIVPTLASACPQITGSGAKPLMTSLLFDSHLLVHVVIYEETEEDIFALTFPDSRLALDEAPALVWSVVNHLRFRFGSLREAFTTRKRELDAFFMRMFNDLLLSSNAWATTRFQDFLPLAQQLVLPEDVKFTLDDALSQFESGDFMDLTEEFYDQPREFDILGSLLFHKGYLLASHLSREDATDVFFWLKFNNLLTISRNKKVGRLVAWQEVHNPAYGRLVLLVVGMGHQILAALLESLYSEGGSFPHPDPFYVDHADNTLDHLHEMGIPLVCDKWLSLPPNPDIIDTDRLYEPKGGGLSASKKDVGGVVLKRTRSADDYYYSSNSSETSDKKETSFNDECTLYEEEETSTAFRGPEERGSLSSRNTTTDEENEEEQLITYRVSQLSLSKENTVFHFIQLDFGDGVFLGPLQPPGGPLHKELLLNVKASAQIIHSTFQMALRNGELLKASESRRVPPAPWLNRPLVAVKEQGILFNWTPPPPHAKGKSNPLHYWVCGRLFLTPSLKECYVCYHDSSPQNMVELAFRLSVGVGI